MSLVKARFGDTLGSGAAGNGSRVQRRGFRLTVFLDFTCPVPRLRRADILAAPRVAFLSLFVGLLQVDPIRATGDSLAGHLCGLVSTRPLSSVSGLVLDFEGRVFALPRARLCFDIEAYCPGLRCFRCHGNQCQLIFEVWVPTCQSVRPPDLWPSEARTPPPVLCQNLRDSKTFCLGLFADCAVSVDARISTELSGLGPTLISLTR